MTLLIVELRHARLATCMRIPSCVNCVEPSLAYTNHVLPSHVRKYWDPC